MVRSVDPRLSGAEVAEILRCSVDHRGVLSAPLAVQTAKVLKLEGDLDGVRAALASERAAREQDAAAASERRIALDLVSGALVDSGVQVPGAMQYGDAIRQIVAAREQAEQERDRLREEVMAPCDCPAHVERKRAETAEAERDALCAERDEVRKSAASEAAAMCERYADRAWKAENECVALRADLARTREALEEVERRASLPITPRIDGMPTSPETLAAALAKCCRLVVDHVVEPARALSPSDTAGDTGASHE